MRIEHQIFGHYIIPDDPNSSCQYVCPANVKVTSEPEDDYHKDDAHAQYFGHNITRVIKTLKK